MSPRLSDLERRITAAKARPMRRSTDVHFFWQLLTFFHHFNPERKTAS